MNATEWLLVGALVLAYALVSLAAFAFQPGQVAQFPDPKGGRHRRGARPELVVPPRGPVGVGGDESQGWWIWRDEN